MRVPVKIRIALEIAIAIVGLGSSVYTANWMACIWCLVAFAFASLAETWEQLYRRARRNEELASENCRRMRELDTELVEHLERMNPRTRDRAPPAGRVQ